MRDLKALIFILLLTNISPAWSNFDDGVAAYERGIMRLLCKNFIPLRSKGMSMHQLIPGIMKNTEKRLEVEAIIKISEDSWCLQE